MPPLPRPAIAFDLDGVICRPLLGLNLAVGWSRVGPFPAALAPERGTPQPAQARLWRLGLEALRFAGRRPMPDAAPALRAVAALRRPLLVTGRSAVGRGLLERWLERYDLRQFFAEVLPNPTTLAGHHYKLWVARTRGLAEHVDDDGATAYYLATNGIPQVYLRDWLLNRGLPYPPNVRVLRSLEELAEHLERGDREAPPGRPPAPGQGA